MVLTGEFCFWGRSRVKAYCLILALAAPVLGACDLAADAPHRRVDGLRSQQDSCLRGNVAQFEDRNAEPGQVGRFVAMSCSFQTEKLVQYALPHPTRRETEAFELDALKRATAYVTQSRSEPS
jgi:hypothetical protein